VDVKLTSAPLRILQISTSDVDGGAEKVALNLFTEYRELGHYSRLAVGYKRSSDSDIWELDHPNSALSIAGIAKRCDEILASWEGRVRGVSRARQLCRELNSGVGSFLCVRAGKENFEFPGSKRLLQTNGFDIVHAHNLHGNYFDLRILPELSRKNPLALTLHDAWLLSGHCAHSFDCMRWQTGCGRCPDLSIYPPIKRDATAFNWRRKLAIFAASRLYVATPCQWLMRRAEISILAPAILDTRVIPNGVDLSIFRPAKDRNEIRRRLGLSVESLIAVFAAPRLRSNAFKDYKTFAAVVDYVAASWKGGELLFLALGDDGSDRRIGPVQLSFIPYISSAGAFAQYLQAADVYVHCARADTFPNSVIEALACGSPVVASAVGGIPEQVEDNKTGFLVPSEDACNMARRLETLLSDVDLRRKMGAAAAETARLKFDVHRQASTYLRWYESISQSQQALARAISRTSNGFSSTDFGVATRASGTRDSNRGKR
jgi:glycosyltransferase involved in cell wall biosynthesis